MSITEENNKDNSSRLSPEEFENLRENVSGRIQKMEERSRRKKLGMVVSLILIFGTIGLVGYNQFIRPDIYTAEYGERNITLSDDTSIRLLGGSKLTVEKSFPGTIREVTLEGNAVFRVSRSEGHPFIVHGSHYDTRVLGTIFKVTQEKEAFKVELYEGKVTVTKKDQRQQTYALRPNQIFNNYGAENIATITPLRQKEDSVSTRDVNKLPKPITLQFKDCPLADAIAVIQQAYNIKVTYPKEYSGRLVTISLKDLSSDIVLKSLALSMQLRLQQYGGIYQLEK